MKTFLLPLYPNYSSKSGKVDHCEIDGASNEARNCTIKGKIRVSRNEFTFMQLDNRFEMKNSCVFLPPQHELELYRSTWLRSIIHI
jgi:hypothetical protein